MYRLFRRLALFALACAPSLALAQSLSKPLVTPKDLGKWESLGAARLSANGNWLAYGVSKGNEENELRVRSGSGESTVVIPFGQAPVFSADSKWIAYLVGVAPKERDRLVKEKKPVRTAFALRNLSTGETTNIPEVTSFAFNPSGGFVSVNKYAAEGKKTNEVLIIDLARNTRVALGNVSETAWSESKPLFAFAVTVDGSAGNAVQVFDGATGSVRVLESTPNVYRALSWRPKSDDLAVMRSAVQKEFADTAHVLLTWSGVSAATSAPRALDGTVASGMPKSTRITDFRRPTWSRDGQTVYFGARTREPVADAVKKSDEKVSDVEIWHTNDVHVIPEQRSNEQRDARSTLLVAWHIGDSKVTAIGSDASENSAILEGDVMATEGDRKPYAFGQKFGRRDSDLWTVNIATGARTKLLTKVRYLFTGDPSGKRVALFDGRDYWTVDVATGTRTNVSAKARAQGANFVDREDDHPVDVPTPDGAPTWTKDGAAILVNSSYDVWVLAVDGSSVKKLTNGETDRIAHRVVSFAGFGGSAADRAVDLSKPLYLTLYGDRTKQSGYARLMPTGEVQRLVFADASVSALAKADSADRFAYVRQSFQESPTVFLAGADLSNAQKVTDLNPFQKDYAWGKAELMNYKSSIGTPLQAILYYPANYDPSKKYPMIVYTYELLSQGLHRYIVPRENDYYNANVFTQNGYFVLMPDIVFRPREPGIAVLHSVEAAVKSVIARGLVDPANIGHCGHSQGGYEAYYLATHSNLFKTAVAGAGISDMWSFAGQMHWSSVPEFDHWETGQFRMQVAPWEDVAAMERNNPITRVNTMPAKSILIEIGGEDPTVDMRQGVEFYNHARRAGKEAVMLLYPGEGHGLGKRENAIDYERRILQWFAYYLKGETPAKWITEGQSWLQRKAILDANK